MEKLRQSRTSAKSEELPAMPDAVFAVSSGPGLPGFEELREAIKQSISDRAAFPDVGAQFPRSYMVLRDEVRMARAAGERPIMEWDEYREKLARPAGIADDGALSTATDLMHTLGELLHYADTEELASTVFPNPSFLIDMMKYVIRHDHEEALRPDPAFVDDMTPATFTEAKQNFLRRGILSHRLLRRMWAPLDLSDLQFERLVQLLEQFEIALGLPDDGVEPRLLVPSFLRDPLPVGAGGAWPAECPADTYEVTRLVDLGNFVPDCFMQRLQVPLCSLLSGRDRSRFACDGAMIVSGKSRLLVRISMTTLEIAVRAKDATTAWRKLLVDALPRVVSVLKKWPAVAFDVWAPWRLASGETRLFLVSSLSERQNGRDHAGVAALSEAWTDALTSAREITDASSAALWTVSSHEVRARDAGPLGRRARAVIRPARPTGTGVGRGGAPERQRGERERARERGRSRERRTGDRAAPSRDRESGRGDRSVSRVRRHPFCNSALLFLPHALSFYPCTTRRPQTGRDEGAGRHRPRRQRAARAGADAASSNPARARAPSSLCPAEARARAARPARRTRAARRTAAAASSRSHARITTPPAAASRAESAARPAAAGRRRGARRRRGRAAAARAAARRGVARRRRRRRSRRPCGTT